MILYWSTNRNSREDFSLKVTQIYTYKIWKKFSYAVRGELHHVFSSSFTEMEFPVWTRTCRFRGFFHRATLSSSWHTSLYNSKKNEPFQIKGFLSIKRIDHWEIGNGSIDLGAETSLSCAEQGTRGDRAVCEAGSCRKFVHWWGVCSLLSCPQAWLSGFEDELLW